MKRGLRSSSEIAKQGDEIQRAEDVITMMKSEKLFLFGESSEVEEDIDEATGYYLGENSIENRLPLVMKGRKTEYSRNPPQEKPNSVLLHLISPQLARILFVTVALVLSFSRVLLSWSSTVSSVSVATVSITVSPISWSYRLHVASRTTTRRAIALVATIPTTTTSVII